MDREREMERRRREWGQQLSLVSVFTPHQLIARVIRDRLADQADALTIGD